MLARYDGKIMIAVRTSESGSSGASFVVTRTVD